jgi:hypothetical protein
MPSDAIGSITITGDGEAEGEPLAGTYPATGVYSGGRPTYATGGDWDLPESGIHVRIFFDGFWRTEAYEDESTIGTFSGDGDSKGPIGTMTGSSGTTGTLSASYVGPAAPSTITLTAASQPSAPGVITP